MKINNKDVQRSYDMIPSNVKKLIKEKSASMGKSEVALKSGYSITTITKYGAIISAHDGITIRFKDAKLSACDLPDSYAKYYQWWKDGKVTAYDIAAISGNTYCSVWRYMHVLINDDIEKESQMKNFEANKNAQNVVTTMANIDNCDAEFKEKIANKMLELRNQQGYCNAEIARALGVAAYKVKELIGPAPRELVLIAQRGNLTNCRERQLAVQRIQAEQAKAQQEMQEETSVEKEQVMMEYPRKLDIVQGKAVPSLLEVMRALTECQNLLLRMMTATEEGKAVS